MPEVAVVRTIWGEKGARWWRWQVSSSVRRVGLEVVVLTLTTAASKPTLMTVKVGLGRVLVSWDGFLF